MGEDTHDVGTGTTQPDGKACRETRRDVGMGKITGPVCLTVSYHTSMTFHKLQWRGRRVGSYYTCLEGG